MTMPNARINWPRSIQHPLWAPAGDGGAVGAAGGDDAAAKAAADAAAATAAAAAGKTPEQIAAEAAEAGKAGTDAAKAAADAKAAEDAAKAGAPAKYTLALPKDGLVDASDVTRIEELARENNLPNDVAQSMLETTNAYLAQQAETWTKELEADKTYGGDKLAATQQSVNAALDLIAPKGTPRGDGLRRLLARGVGNNLDVVAALATVGRMTREDLPVGGAAGGGESKQKSPAEVLYPNSPEFKK